MQNMAPGGLLCHTEGNGLMTAWELLHVLASSVFPFGFCNWKNTWACENMEFELRKDVVAYQCVCIHMDQILFYSISLCVCVCVCLPVLHFKYSHCVYTVRVSLSAWLCLWPCMWVSTGRLGARGAGGAFQGGLREASGKGSDAGVCQRGGREQLIPATDCGRQVQVLQKDLGHSHEALVVHTPIIPPHDYLWRRQRVSLAWHEYSNYSNKTLLTTSTCRTLPWGLSSNNRACW